jgi:hypothetical protein
VSLLMLHDQFEVLALIKVLVELAFQCFIHLVWVLVLEILQSLQLSLVLCHLQVLECLFLLSSR